MAVHPGFLASVLRAREQAQGFDVGDLVPRLEAILPTYSRFFISTASNAWLVHKDLLSRGGVALAVPGLPAGAGAIAAEWPDLSPPRGALKSARPER